MDARQTVANYIRPSAGRRTFIAVFGALAAAAVVVGFYIFLLTTLTTLGGLMLLGGVLMLAVWVCFIPDYRTCIRNMDYTLDRLEELGLLENAAAQLNGEERLTVGDDLSRLTPGFAFRRGRGLAVAYEDIVWVMVYPGRSQEIEVTTNIRTGRSFDPVGLPNTPSNYDAINRTFEYIAFRCPNALKGYSENNASAYRALIKQYKSEAKAAKKK